MSDDREVLRATSEYIRRTRQRDIEGSGDEVKAALDARKGSRALLLLLRAAHDVDDVFANTIEPKRRRK